MNAIPAIPPPIHITSIKLVTELIGGYTIPLLCRSNVHEAILDPNTTSNINTDMNAIGGAITKSIT